MEMKLKLNDPAAAKTFFEQKLAFTMGPMELKYYVDQKESLNIIDVRAADDFAEGHVPGARSLPEDDWSSANGLSKDKMNVIYCYSQVCHLAARACAHFASRGFPVMEMDGGMEAWRDYFADNIEKRPAQKVA
jgi:rhodanese-related sulfurtransferase